MNEILNEKRKVFTDEVIDRIYEKLGDKISNLPNLGEEISSGWGSVCLEELNDMFLVYVVDRTTKYDVAEFLNVKDAVDYMISTYYSLYESEEKAMKKTFYDELNIGKDKTRTIKKPIKK